MRKLLGHPGDREPGAGAKPPSSLPRVEDLRQPIGELLAKAGVRANFILKYSPRTQEFAAVIEVAHPAQLTLPAARGIERAVIANMPASAAGSAIRFYWRQLGPVERVPQPVPAPAAAVTKPTAATPAPAAATPAKAEAAKEPWIQSIRPKGKPPRPPEPKVDHSLDTIEIGEATIDEFVKLTAAAKAKTNT